MKEQFGACMIERSPINGNFTLWLPEQEGLIEWIEQKHNSSQGNLWHALILAASALKNVDLTGIYIEPEGDVFVAYAKDVNILISMSNLLNELIDRKTFMLKAAEYGEAHNYFTDTNFVF